MFYRAALSKCSAYTLCLLQASAEFLGLKDAGGEFRRDGTGYNPKFQSEGERGRGRGKERPRRPTAPHRPHPNGGTVTACVQ